LSVQKAKLEGFLIGLAFMALTIIAMTIFSRMVLNAWDFLMLRLEQAGYPMPETEYLLGAFLFFLLCYLGAIKLKRLGRG